MFVGTFKETVDGESRVAISPESCKKLSNLGYTILIEKDAGVNSSFSNLSYESAGAKLIDNKFDIINQVDILLSVTSIPDDKIIEKSKQNLIIVGTFDTYENYKTLQSLAIKKINVISLDLLPRISRAQSMDVLSSQANLAGYKAVILASNLFKKAFPMMMTAAGTIIPAKCLVLGAGVAGLQAIATAKRLGCVVTAFDVRPEVEEQVKSLGAKFIKVDNSDSTVQENSVYAKEMTEEYKLKQKAKIHDSAKDMDIIITTAMIPGKKAPILIENKTIREMKLGSVIIDLAGASGGNTEGVKFGKEIKIDDVVINSPTNLPSLVSFDASSLYSKNIFNFITSFLDDRKSFDINSDDELLTKTIIIKNGVKTENFLKENKNV
ncbi:MAG: NAD(P)(+) transhydrogenase (Re/Si-specific) subunit alpha [Pelagibacterales bacterium]|nr:NAD(P)(+) transhydrogenase (Re/Si-specific) subunit alpha [Pelagibacterales bacterium]|tara:strand:+ start:4903 stop:6042 length:1140 start_codon:yes stop_codon:yes gene_type:complete